MLHNITDKNDLTSDLFSVKSLLVELKNVFSPPHLFAAILLEKENMSTPYGSTYWTEHTQTVREPELWLVNNLNWTLDLCDRQYKFTA